MDFSSFKAIEQFIIDSTEEVLANEVSDMAKKAQRDRKKSRFYDTYTPTEYQRTEEFLNANETRMLKRQKNNIWMWLYTPTTLQYMPSRHPSIVDGSNQNKNIPYWTQYGNGNSPIFSYAGRDWLNPTVDLINEKIRTTFIMGMRKLGIQAY